MKLKQTFHLVVLALLLSTFNINLSPANAQGSLTPPGPPGATMLTLSQVEPRTPISSVPITITQPGSYYLTTNLVCSVSNAITIAVSGVSLDLSGFTISSTVANAANGGTAILFNSGLRNFTIANGFIQGGVTNNGSGVYSGSGFGYGIYYSGTPPANLLVSQVTVSGCLDYGIFVNDGETLVESCMVRTVGSVGIFACTIEHSLVFDCGGYAIEGDQVSDSRGQSTGSGTGVYAYYSTLNCFGYSSSGYGIDSYIAQNCFGYCNNGSDPGIYVTTIAICCYGYSYTGYGIDAYTANSCYSNSGDSGILHPYNMP